MKNKLKSAAIAGLVAGLFAGQAGAVAVDLELILMTDVSGSVSGTDFDTMRNGYVAAFQNPALHAALSQGAIGSIAVTLVYWSGAGQQQQTVGWTQISDAASANAFAAAVAAAARPFSASTGMTGALNFSAGLFNGNGFEGTRNVIDVAGDGSESVACNFSDAVCGPLQAARAAALAGGVTTINALWIEDNPFFGDDPGDTINALTYGTTNVIGGANAFQNIVAGFNDFAPAILSKLQRELVGVPEPGTLALLGLGLLGMGIAGRRRMAVAR